MKKSNQLLLTLIISLFLFSCEKDDTTNNESLPTATNSVLSKELTTSFASYTKNAPEYNLLNIFNTNDDCFVFEYPATFDVNNGQETIEVTNDNEFASLLFGATISNIKTYEQRFPKKIITSKGEKKTLTTKEELDSLIKNCQSSENTNNCTDCIKNCFTIIFPINVTTSNGLNEVINNNDEGVALIDKLKKDDAYFMPSFPMNIISKDKPVVVNDSREFIRLFNECNN